MSTRGDIQDRMDDRVREKQIKDVQERVAAGGRILPWQMAVLLADAKDRLGGHTAWKHSVSGTIYFVRGVCLRESDMAPLVKYSPDHLEGGSVELTRPLSEWLEVVDVKVRDAAADVTDTERRTRFVPMKKAEVWVEA